MNTEDREGRYFPDTYIIPTDDTPSDVGATMFQEFASHTEKIKKPKASAIINEDTIINIASIIQRPIASVSLKSSLGP